VKPDFSDGFFRWQMRAGLLKQRGKNLSSAILLYRGDLFMPRPDSIRKYAGRRRDTAIVASADRVFPEAFFAASG